MKTNNNNKQRFSKLIFNFNEKKIKIGQKKIVKRNESKGYELT